MANTIEKKVAKVCGLQIFSHQANLVGKWGSKKTDPVHEYVSFYLQSATLILTIRFTLLVLESAFWDWGLWYLIVSNVGMSLQI